MSYSLLSMITANPFANAAIDEDDEESQDGESYACRSSRGKTNSDGAWCWRDDCSGKLRPVDVIGFDEQSCRLSSLDEVCSTNVRNSSGSGGLVRQTCEQCFH
jgi:sorting nexin-9/18/33